MSTVFQQGNSKRPILNYSQDVPKGNVFMCKQIIPTNVKAEIDTLSFENRNEIITKIGDILFEKRQQIVKENKKDLKVIEEDDSMYDRLLLNQDRIQAMSQSCYALASINDPLKKYSQEENIQTKA